MTRATIDHAKTDGDLQAVKDLCWQFRDWLLIRYEEHPNVVDSYYGVDAFAELLESLPSLHKPPTGCILLAKVGSSPVGCVMIQSLEPGVCEMKRMFVSSEGRGHGIGSALVQACLEEGRAMDYHTMFLDTGHPQREAYALYKKHGFTDREAYYDAPPKLAPILHYLERKL